MLTEIEVISPFHKGRNFSKILQEYVGTDLDMLITKKSPEEFTLKLYGSEEPILNKLVMSLESMHASYYFTESNVEEFYHLTDERFPAAIAIVENSKIDERIKKHNKGLLEGRYFATKRGNYKSVRRKGVKNYYKTNTILNPTGASSFGNKFAKHKPKKPKTKDYSDRDIAEIFKNNAGTDLTSYNVVDMDRVNASKLDIPAIQSILMYISDRSGHVNEPMQEQFIKVFNDKPEKVAKAIVQLKSESARSKLFHNMILFYTEYFTKDQELHSIARSYIRDYVNKKDVKKFYGKKIDMTDYQIKKIFGV